jgi:transposase
MLTMNSEEQLTLDIILKISTGTMSRKTAQQVLNVSERTLRRYLKRYDRKGPVFVKHGNCNRVAPNKTNSDLKKQVQDLVKDEYFDLNMSHCLEKLEELHSIKIKRETFRKWVHEIDMVKRPKRRRSKVRKHRERMQQTGLMLQMDGSPYHWFGGKPSCLIAAIDDADGEVPFGVFSPQEDTLSCMWVLQNIIQRKGIFHVLYVDKAGIFGGAKRDQFSQVKRACKELGIHVIFANSPQAKGRIERLWDTCQDRLVPEMRLRNIKSYEAANHYIQEQYFPNEHNPKFKVVPENLQTAYRLLPKDINLNEIFCLKHKRRVAKDHTISYEGDTYLIDSPLKYSIYKQKIELRIYRDNTWKAFFAGKPITLKRVKKTGKASATLKDFRPDVEVNFERVRMDEHVRFQGHYYSVAKKYIGEKVSIYEQNGMICISNKGKLIEKHSKITDPNQRCSTKPNHLSAWTNVLSETSAMRKTAASLGPSVDKLILAILQQGQGFVDNRSIYGILDSEKYYSSKMIDEACNNALQIESPTLKAVKLFLKLQIGTKTQKATRTTKLR